MGSEAKDLKHLVVIGGGNTAMDVAQTALRLNCAQAAA